METYPSFIFKSNLLIILERKQDYNMGSAVGSCCAQTSQLQNNKGKKLNRSSSSLSVQKRLIKKQSQEDTNSDFTQIDILKLLGNLVLVMKQIRIEDFDIEGIIGTGAFGIVYLGQLKKEKKQGKDIKYAIKKMPKELIVKKNLFVNVRDQRDMMTTCNKFMVSLIFAFQDSWSLYLVMQYAVGGDTYDLIKPGSYKLQMYKKLGEYSVKFIAACIILALQCIHARNFIYRDLKPQNVLLFQNGYVKLTDFGLVKKLTSRKNQTISGTQLYFAPQMLLKKGYGNQIDFWTLGIYIYELSNYKPPFNQGQITKLNFQSACLRAQKNRVWENPNLSQQIKDLINRLLKFCPNQRIGVNGGWKQIKQHPFFKDFDWQKLTLGQLQSPLHKIVNMFPPSVKPFRSQDLKIEGAQTKFQGWSYEKQKFLS